MLAAAPMDKTITEYELDPATEQVVQGFIDPDGEPDLAVDGLDESLASRLLKLLNIGRG